MNMNWIVLFIFLLSSGVFGNLEKEPINLLQNPGFEEGNKDQPNAWRFGTARPDNFEVSWSNLAHSGKRSVYLHSKTAVMSGYWTQLVDVIPGTTYQLTCWVRMTGGKVLVYVLGYQEDLRHRADLLDARTYIPFYANHPLVPVFIKPEYLKGAISNRWHQVTLKFTPKEPIHKVAINLGMYFQPGEVWFDDVSLVPLSALYAAQRLQEYFKVYYKRAVQPSIEMTLPIRWAGKVISKAGIFVPIDSSGKEKSTKAFALGEEPLTYPRRIRVLRHRIFLSISGKTPREAFLATFQLMSLLDEKYRDFGKFSKSPAADKADLTEKILE